MGENDRKESLIPHHTWGGAEQLCYERTLGKIGPVGNDLIEALYHLPTLFLFREDDRHSVKAHIRHGSSLCQRGLPDTHKTNRVLWKSHSPIGILNQNLQIRAPVGRLLIFFL